MYRIRRLTLLLIVFLLGAVMNKFHSDLVYIIASLSGLILLIKFDEVSYKRKMKRRN